MNQYTNAHYQERKINQVLNNVVCVKKLGLYGRGTRASTIGPAAVGPKLTLAIKYSKYLLHSEQITDTHIHAASRISNRLAF